MLTRLRLFVHERDGHDDVVRDREADLQIRAQGGLHAEENIAKDGQELGVRSGLEQTRLERDEENCATETYGHEVQDDLLEVIED